MRWCGVGAIAAVCIYDTLVLRVSYNLASRSNMTIGFTWWEYYIQSYIPTCLEGWVMCRMHRQSVDDRTKSHFPVLVSSELSVSEWIYLLTVVHSQRSLRAP